MSFMPGIGHLSRELQIRQIENANRDKVEGLDPQWYLKQTQTIKNKQEIISIRARELFMANVLSFIPDGDLALTAMGKTKEPIAKDSKMYEIVHNQVGAVEMYTELARPMALLIVTSQDPEDIPALKAYAEVVAKLKKEAEDQLKEISAKHENAASIQMGLLFSEAFGENFPSMIPYYTIGRNKGFPAKLSTYILKNQDTLFADVTLDNFEIKFTELKSQLQFVEPSLKSFEEVLNCFAGYILSLFYSTKVNGDAFDKSTLLDEQEDHIDAVIEGSLKLIDELAKTDKKIADFRKSLTDSTPIVTNTAGLAFPFFDLVKSLMVPPNPGYDTNILGRLDKELENFKIADTKKALDKAKTTCNVLFRICQGSLLIAGTYDNFTAGDALKSTGTFIKDFTLYAGDAVSSFKAGNSFLTNAVFGGLTKVLGKSLMTSFPAINKSLGVLFGSSVGEFFTNRVGPVFLLIDAINTFNSMDINTDDQTAYALKFTTFVFQAVGGIGGLVAGLLGAAAISAYIVGVAGLAVAILAVCLSVHLMVKQNKDIKDYFISLKLDSTIINYLNNK